MTGNDLDNNSKAKQKETSEKEDLSKYFIKQPKEMNAEELIVNNGQPEKEDANDEPIYAISDFEGRYDYYIRFLIDIGFFDKDALCNAVKTQIEQSGKQEEEKNKELEMLKILFTKSQQMLFWKFSPRSLLKI